VTCVPAHAFELVEVAAVRSALAAGHIEGRQPLNKPLDVLLQHMVTIALGGGFRADELLAEVRRTHAYRHLDEREWQWALGFVASGGDALERYPEYHRVVCEQGVYRVVERDIATRHRMSIGTIVADPDVEVRFLKGGRLGTVNESFVSRMQPGDRFVFAGRTLEFIRLKDMTAWVRLSQSRRGTIPAWMGTSLPITPELGAAVRAKLDEAAAGVLEGPEMLTIRPLLALQQKWSRIPEADDVLIEAVETREGHHIFIYPFEGKLVHQGLAALFAYRISRLLPITFTLTANDYGFELLSPEPAPLEAALNGSGNTPPLFSPDSLLGDIRASLNASEMARRQFREIARVAGLVFPGRPGQRRTTRQLQTSTGLLFDVFSRYDADNLLLAQAHQEVLERQLEQSRIGATLRRLAGSRLVVVRPFRPSPLSFPLFVSRMQAQLSSEQVSERIRRMVVQLESDAEWEPEPPAVAATPPAARQRSEE
jgi:ATP-dependent Lhr-like helicase